MACIIIDFQGFRGAENVFIFKEIAALTVNCETFYTFLFSPPTEKNSLPQEIQHQNTWLANNHHGLEYDRGFTSYEELYNILHDLLSDFQTVYVKGREKRNEILKVFDHQNIINIEDLGCPSIKQLSENYCSTACLWHKNRNSTCATLNVKNIRFWYNEHFRTGRISEPNKDYEYTSTCWCFCE